MLRYASDGVGWGGDDDATQMMGWMITFLALAHLLDATQVMGWRGGEC